MTAGLPESESNALIPVEKQNHETAKQPDYRAQALAIFRIIAGNSGIDPGARNSFDARQRRLQAEIGNDGSARYLGFS